MAQPIDMPFGLRTRVGAKKSCVVVFSFSIRTSPQHRSIQVCENIDGVDILLWKVFVEVYRPATLSVCEGVILHTLCGQLHTGVIGLSIWHN